jgi:hypothetical protein
MSYNLNITHPLIENAQKYTYYRKCVTIHSEDRDYLKYPSSSEFEITLPQDYLNVQSVKLSSWSFPYNMNVFSSSQKNTSMTFKIDKPYNPGEFDQPNVLQNAIFAGLYNYYNDGNQFTINIESGNYTTTTIVAEIQNKMNYAVTAHLLEYFSKHYPELVAEFELAGGYSSFVLAYNVVEEKMWFGNKCDGFILTNETVNLSQLQVNACDFHRTNAVPSFSDAGLPGRLGFTRCNSESIKVLDKNETRFYYGNVNTATDNGYWLLPDPTLIGSTCYFIKPPYKINIYQNISFYMDIQLLNCIDELAPYNISNFTIHNSQNNGLVNSAFAKISSQNFANDNLTNFFQYASAPFKYFDPPAERIRKLSIKIRNHDGTLLNFNNLPFTFTLEFGLMTNSALKEYREYIPKAN